MQALLAVVLIRGAGIVCFNPRNLRLVRHTKLLGDNHAAAVDTVCEQDQRGPSLVT